MDHSRRQRRLLLHGVRLAMFATVLLLIRYQHQERQRGADQEVLLSPTDVNNVFADARRLGKVSAGQPIPVLDAAGATLGSVVQTSPASDHLVGFSGPTNVLIAFGPDQRICAVRILSSGDTREHVRQVREDPSFLSSFEGLTWEEAARSQSLDGVSGATLTSLAIQEAILLRLGGGQTSLRFPEPLLLDEVRSWLPQSESLTQVRGVQNCWQVWDARQQRLGNVWRSSPVADNIIGYQGPTDTRIAVTPNEHILGIAVGSSYDNEPYVTYVRQDAYFNSLFNDQTLEQVAQLDLWEAGIEGVSGATMTSQAVAEGVVLTAKHAVQAQAAESAESWNRWTWRDLGTSAVLLGALVIGWTRLRGRKWLRIGFQVILIGYLGLTNGDMLSQAMLVGWAQSGIPWRTAGGLTLLAAAALLIPMVTKHNVYCAQICPHGAVQQLLRTRRPRLRLSRRLVAWLKVLPVLLLAWCIVVPMLALSFSLVDIEPFDAWVFRVAGWSTIVIAIVGLVASLFVPMAYCRFGCPTGLLLNFLRFNSSSDRWSRRDWWACALVALAVGLAWTN